MLFDFFIVGAEESGTSDSAPTPHARGLQQSSADSLIFLLVLFVVLFVREAHTAAATAYNKAAPPQHLM
jgi:hypothetical protein